MALDYAVTVFAVRPLRRALGRARRGGVPVLMYHSVGEDTSSARHPYFDICTAPARFAEQMRALREGDYRPVAPAEVLGASGRGVCITFDDGYRDNLTAAWPVLKEYGYTASIFVVTDRVGKDFKGRPCLSWDEIRHLRREGARIGSHTVSHPELVRSSDDELEGEWRESKSCIEQELGERIDTFSYPYAFPEADGRFVERLRGILSRLGYRCGVTTILGTARPGDDAFFLKRLPVSTRDDRALFAAKLEGAYDWLHGLQLVSKHIGRAVSAVPLRRRSTPRDTG